ncbi:uncharacterized protein LOC135848371 [Planococcus citri]|uniref:uncharacterized protein LOC135848371 n=1 Tax=Planococcus citri TaxID=170843 RepID=UPI0031F862A5
MRHTHDATSVDTLIKELKLKDNHPIVYYKSQGDVDENHPFLKSSDFVAIIMNDGQKEMLLEYGTNILCFDGTHGMGYDFVLYTLLVIDAVNQGFPTGFLITNRSDQLIFEFFFQRIKDNAGAFNCKVFMSDMEVSFSNAWTNVMGEPEKILFYSWHVLRAWNQNLNRISGGEGKKSEAGDEKIDAENKKKEAEDRKKKVEEKKSEVKKMLRCLLEELDQNKFELLLPATIDRLKEDKLTESYAEYFESNYVDNCTKWAYCYRKNAGLNSNMHLESLHKTWKYVYLEGKKVKRLDKTISILMRFIRDRLFDQVILFHKGKLTKKIQDLRRRHRTASGNPTNLITFDDNDQRWIISSKEIYYVEKNSTLCECKLICTLCNACIHQYSCTCIDYCIKWNMCKHIHGVCMLVNQSKTNVDASDPTSNFPTTDNSPESDVDVSAKNTHNVPTPTPTTACIDAIQKVLTTDKEQDVSKEDLMKAMEEVVNLAQSKRQRKMIMSDIMKMKLRVSAESVPSLHPVTKAPRDYVRKIVQQKRLYSTKKKQQKKLNVIEHITSEEKNDLQLDVMFLNVVTDTEEEESYD